MVLQRSDQRVLPRYLRSSRGKVIGVRQPEPGEESILGVAVRCTQIFSTLVRCIPVNKMNLVVIRCCVARHCYDG